MIPCWLISSKRELAIVSISSRMPVNIFSASFVPWSTFFVFTQASIPPSLAIKELGQDAVNAVKLEVRKDSSKGGRSLGNWACSYHFQTAPMLPPDRAKKYFCIFKGSYFVSCDLSSSSIIAAFTTSRHD